MKIHKIVFSPIAVNTYIIDNGYGKCAIVDCGCYDNNEFEQLKSFLQKNNLVPELLLNTHMHLDHVFGNGMIFEEYKLLTHCTAEEEDNRLSATSHAAMFGLSMDVPPKIGTTITDGSIINFGDKQIKALFVPGHTAGSVAYYIESEKFVITGDALFAGSIGRTDLPGGDYDTLISSISNKLLVLDSDVVVYPGHGNESTIGNEKENNPYLN